MQSKPRPKIKPSCKINNLVVISDEHCGCKLGLCHKEGASLDGEKDSYKPSKLQLAVWSMWDEFTNDFIPEITQGEPYAVLNNGDSIEGTHHGVTTPISHNILDQIRLAKKILLPLRDACEGRLYFTRGTDAHVGQSATYEEQLAESLEAVKDKDGKYARYELWLEMGNKLIHALHHVGNSNMSIYNELRDEYEEAGKLDLRKPDMIIRSHMHRYFKAEMATSNGNGIGLITPAWQLKGSHTFKIRKARVEQPQIGGIVIRKTMYGLEVHSKVWCMDRSPAETI